MYRLVYFGVLVATSFAAVVEDESTAIINGELANIEDFPYYAFIAKGGNLHCGGAFIETDLVLTAAHCLKDADMTIYSGITALRDLKRRKAYEVKKVAPHPDFFATGDSAVDIGLIRLKTKIELGNKAQLIELADKAPAKNEEAAVVGFGIVKCKGVYSCHNHYRVSKHLRSTMIAIANIQDNGILITKSRGNRSTCYGDSGGPITFDGKVVGVVSSGEFGDCTGYDVQGPVFTMLNWIEETKKDM